jgi:hypothetical protein
MPEALNQNANQPQSTPAAKNQLARGWEKVSLWLAWIGIPVFLALLGYTVWLIGWTRGSMDADAFLQRHAQFSIPAGISSPDLQKAIDAAVDASMKREELLLDKLLLVVGLYSTILSVLALATVIFSRQDAEKQLATVNAKAESLAADVKQTLADIQAKAQKDVTALETRVESEFPIISRLQSRVQNLIFELEDRFPEDENLNRSRSDTRQAEEKKQNSLIDESKILAVSVVALDDASLVKLYLALARFYFDLYKTPPNAESDAARSYAYASRAIRENPKSVDAYRMRGAITLTRCEARRTKNAEEAQDLLQQARTDFNQCKDLDPHDAGALYNLALSSLLEYKLKKTDKFHEAVACLDQAIQVSEALFGFKKIVPRAAKEKYFPDVYINLACCLALKSASATERAEKDTLYGQVVKFCKEGKEYLIDDVESSKANNNFKESLKRELDAADADGDFAALPETTRTELSALLSTSWDKPDGPASGERRAATPLAHTGGD